MRPVPQRTSTDCLSACLASLLEVPLALVPDYSQHGAKGQMERTQKWLRRFNLTFLDVWLCRRRGRQSMPWCPTSPSYAIATVMLPRSTAAHAVVVRVSSGKVEWVHDPAGGRRADYGRFIQVGFLIPTDPRITS